MSRVRIALGVAALAGVAGGAQAQDGGDVASFRLDSGVEVLLERVPDATAMGLFLFVRSGYVEDPAGKTGLAHLTEHLVMTCATPARDEVWNYMRWNQERPGANAMTRATWTVYWCLGDRDPLSVDARRFAEILDGKARFTEQQFEFERVMMLRETVNMTEAVPGGVLQWRAMQHVRNGEPHGRQGIGIKAEVQKLAFDDVKRHYEAYHVPQRALVVAVGKVDPKKDRPFYEEVFGGLKPRPVPERDPAPAAPLPPEVSTHPRIGGVFATFAIPAPEPGAPEFPAFALAAMWLCQRAQMSFSYRGLEGMGFFLPGLFAMLENPYMLLINRRGKEGESVATVRSELTEWLAEASRVKIAAPMLIFPRRQLENLLDPRPRSEFRRRLLAKQPRMLYVTGMSRGTARMWGLPADLWQRIEKTTPDEVRAVVRERFVPERARFLALVPEKK